MTDNELLARWQGYTFVYDSADGHVFTPPNKPKAAWQPIVKLPDYPNDAAACISLLDTLVERDKWFILQNDSDGGFALEIGGLLDFRDSIFVVEQSTINEAIIAACLEVARSEATNRKEAQGD